MKKNKRLARVLQLGTILSFFFVLFIFGFYIPQIAADFRTGAPEFASYYWKMLIPMETVGVACLVALALFWRITVNIGRGHSFTPGSKSSMRGIALCATYACLILFLMAAIAPGFPYKVLFLMATFVAGIISVASYALTYLIGQAALLQDEYDLTV